MLWTLIVATALLAAGCATATLPYTPEEQPRGARVSAAYQVLAHLYPSGSFPQFDSTRS